MRLVFTKHENSIWWKCEWVDAYGHHSRSRAADPDALSVALINKMTTVIEENPDVARWQLDGFKDNFTVAVMSHNSETPVEVVDLPPNIMNKLADLMAWCGGYCTVWCDKNTLYEDERALEREMQKLSVRLKELQNKRGS